MATVLDLVLYLRELPPDTEVEVVQAVGNRARGGVAPQVLPLDLIHHTTHCFFDFNHHPLVAESSPLHGKRILTFGQPTP